ncbi:sushi, nidogen and EGF-like domain-containing protein 1 [Dysidea avara]|uniref:sushi, nidogen and EGF-like domain-containing protein 1 n=1 Tax=Dysidea avara TaxID=196820 RepID=UPI003333B013
MSSCLQLYPFGTAQSDARLPPLDDGSSSAITLIRSFRFYGPASSTAYVNSNGVVSLDRSFTSFSPRSLPLNGTDKIIAPYWDDVDTRGIGNIYYRQTTDPSLLARATSEIRVASPMSEPLSNLFIATWDAVGSFPRGTNMTNTFQCILAYSAVESFVIFLYDDGGIEWGRGLAGINAGNRVSSVTIPGSRTVNILNIDQTTNIGIPGVWVFQVDRVSMQQWLKANVL